MSGVTAAVDWRHGRPTDVEVQAMAGAAAFRGTVGTWSEPGVTLGAQCRPGPGRPVDGGSAVVVADARVDNGPELADRLGRPEPRSDGAQLLAAAWFEWGEALADHVRGDYAAAIWTPASRTLTLLADPMGMRTLYVWQAGGRAAVGTEIAMVTAHSGVPRRLREDMAARYLAGGCESGAETFYEGVDKIEPGTVRVLTAGRDTTRRVWSIDPRHRLTPDSEEEAAAVLSRSLLQSVAERTDGTAQLGLLLSGGVDSGSTAAAAVAADPTVTSRLHTYQFSFVSLPECDERDLSSPLAAHLGLGATVVDADGNGPLAGHPAHGPHADHPYVGAFQPALETALTVAAGAGATAMLSGDRGDLLLGDVVYDFAGLLRAGRMRSVGEDLDLLRVGTGRSRAHVAARQMIGPTVGRLWSPDRVPRLRARLADDSRQSEGPAWIPRSVWTRHGLADRLAEPEPTPSLAGTARRHRHHIVFGAEAMRGMAWSERTWARAGMEFRDPFSDSHLVRTVLALPQWRVQRVAQPKRLLRLAAATFVAPTFVDRMRKTEPGPLYERDLRSTRAPLVRSLLSDTHLAELGMVDQDRLLSEYETSRPNGPIPHGLWAALTLAWWLRAHWA